MADLNAFESYRSRQDAVAGWLMPGIFDCLRRIHHLQQKLEITGAVYEIGVHHGRFFIALHNLKDPGKVSVAIDLFEDQNSNVDKSGRGSLEILQENLQRFAHEPDQVAALTLDSLSLNGPAIAKLIDKYGEARLFSVDGGHEVEHTMNDLRVAQEILAAGGVIFVDDYYNSHWPGVHEGCVRFFSAGLNRVAPFVFSSNKLMLTSLGFHRRYFHAFQEAFAGKPRVKVVRMYGYDVLVIPPQLGEVK